MNTVMFNICNTRIKYLYIILLLLLFSTVSNGEWPTDNEDYGLMGCRFFQYQGIWETKVNAELPEDNTAGACLTVAVANVINYHQWPKTSFFDGFYITEQTTCIPKIISHTWNYNLINGEKDKDEDCETDDPFLRKDQINPQWTGVNEIQKLMYTVERSFGKKYNYFVKILKKDNSEVFPLHHILKNRFGYANCRMVKIKNEEILKSIIRNLSNNYPVIILEDYHSYVLDGYKPATRFSSELFHSADYFGETTSMGWFEWREIEKYALRVILDITPVVSLSSVTKTKSITYNWGDKYIPFTSNTKRIGFFRIQTEDSSSLENVDFQVIKSEDSTNSKPLYTCLGGADKSFIRIPQSGTFEIDIKDKLDLILNITNNSNEEKKVKITLHDFENDHDISLEENKLFPTALIKNEQLVYPNNDLTIKYNVNTIQFYSKDLKSLLSLRLYNVLGKMIHSIHNKTPENSGLIMSIPTNETDRGKLSKGMYILYIKNVNNQKNNIVKFAVY